MDMDSARQLLGVHLGTEYGVSNSWQLRVQLGSYITAAILWIKVNARMIDIATPSAT